MQHFLPIRAVTIRLQFIQASYAPFFHQVQLRPFLKELLQDKAALDAEQGIWVEAIESGRIVYAKGEEYRFNLFCLARAYPLLVSLLDQLRRLPQSYPGRRKQNGLFHRNLQFIGLIDYFSQQAITHQDQLFTYDQQALQRELDFWQAQDSIQLRFTSPARFKTRKKQAGVPFIHDKGQIQTGEIERRIYKALYNLDPETATLCPQNQPSYQQVSDRLFWTDNASTQKDSGRLAPFGGVLGDISLSQPDNGTPHLAQLILAQYTGIGERRGYGLGRYRLQTRDGQGTTPAKTGAQTIRQRSATINTLEQACYNIARKHPWTRHYIDHNLHDFDSELENLLEDKNALNHINLYTLAQSLKQGNYQASVLQGVILHQKDRHPRPLAIPPLQDRIAQRAVVEIMGVAIDQLATRHSYGYRKGMSRQQARDKILSYNRQGYRWFFEADIEEFFDLVSHADIENRLHSFFPDEPIIPLIMDWISAPVQFDGQTIPREAGLPQGSPISPMLANLMLEDFDADLEAAGMKLVRFADDFVILAKSRHQAQQAMQRAEQSLQEIGLVFNPDKTHIGEFSEGFQFLGYTFLNDLALEHKRPSQSSQKLTLNNIPSASWLAKLLQYEPSRLTELNQTLDKKHRTNDLSAIVNTHYKDDSQTKLSHNDIGATLFITQPPKHLRQKNGKLEILEKDAQQASHRINWNQLNHIVLIGRHSYSQHVLHSALQQQINLHHLSSTGKYLGLSTATKASAEGPELWLQQSQHYQHPEQRLKLVQQLVESRIHNQRHVLLQRLRHDTQANDTSQNHLKALQKLCEQVTQSTEIEQIRGYEGNAAAHYFAQLSQWVPEDFGFEKRNKRPPRDPFNALLSLGYSILYSHTASILQIAGLYPWQGFYHQGYGRHMALASDLMEAYRHIIERTALTLLRAGQLKPEDFYRLDNGACQLTRDALRIYLNQLSQRMLKPISSQTQPEPITLHQHILQNAFQLIRNIRHPASQVDFYRLK